MKDVNQSMNAALEKELTQLKMGVTVF